MGRRSGEKATYINVIKGRYMGAKGYIMSNEQLYADAIPVILYIDNITLRLDEIEVIQPKLKKIKAKKDEQKKKCATNS